jgi:AI-2 transport protein TqsA
VANSPVAGLSGAARLLLVGAAFVVVIAGMRAAASILIPILLALFLALLCLPAVRWMHAKRVPNALAVPVVLVMAVLLGAALFSLISHAVGGFAEAAAEYAETVSKLWKSIEDKLEVRFGGEIPDEIAQALDPSRLLGLVGIVLGQLTGLIGSLLMIVLMVVFLLFELLALPNKLAAMSVRSEDCGQFDRIVRSINRYISIKTFVSLLTGLTAGVACAVIGVPHAPLWGICAFLLNFIPNIGSVLAAVPPLLLVLVVPELGVADAIAIAGTYFGINFVFGNMVEPKMMGRSLDLSTLVVFMSMVFWGWVFGAVGMFLSVPLTMVIKIALEGAESTRPIAILLGAEPPVAPEAPDSREPPPAEAEPELDATRT